MIGNTSSTNDSRLGYMSPEVNEIPMDTRNVLCQSPGNESMPEYDYGDGGFSEA